MSNTYFQFKQFRVDQDKSGMKVTTDACLFGSLINTTSANKILDIGTGTGLLPLMIAQKSHCQIDAIEIDNGAYEQASENIKNSPWSDRIKILHQDARVFISEHKYDLIISNPPFFSNHLQGKRSQKNKALHTETLSFDELVKTIQRNLASSGILWILLPPFQMSEMETILSKEGLHMQRKVIVYNRKGEDEFRHIAVFNGAKQELSVQELIIREDGNEYSQEFVDLLKPYYLHL